LYDAVAFELAAQDILDAHRYGDVALARKVTETVRTLAGSNEYLIAFAMTIEAQQYILEGDLTAAALVLSDLESLEVHGRDHYIMARGAYCNAMLSLVRGFHEDAYAIANGARPAIAALEAGFGFRAATIAGRAALLAGLPWTPPSDLMDKYPNLWTRPETEGVLGRHLLAHNVAAARTIAENALARSDRHRSAVLLTAFVQSLRRYATLRGTQTKRKSFGCVFGKTRFALGTCSHSMTFSLYPARRSATLARSGWMTDSSPRSRNTQKAPFPHML